jgi:N6-adenosine-specific RNA methylase IME4
MSRNLAPGGIEMPGSPVFYEKWRAGFEAYEKGDALDPPGHEFANMFPMLPQERRKSFRASLENEQKHPIVLHRGFILDGRNRARELIALNKPIAYVVFTGSNRDALDFVVDENLERRDLTDKQRARIAAQIATRRLGDNQYSRPPSGPQLPGLTQTAEAPPNGGGDGLSHGEAAKLMHVPLRSVERAAVIERKGTSELKEAVERGPVSLAAGAAIAELDPEEQKKIIATADPKIIQKAAKEINQKANQERRAERAERIRKLADASAELPTGRKFPLIYFDPPTKFAAGDSNRSTENHYPTMTAEEIAALPIGDLALPHAVLLMWTTVPWLRKSIRLIEGWGFEFKSAGFWDKVDIATGFWWQGQIEILIAATRGKPPAPENGSILGPSLYREKKTDHSAKPLYFRDRIDAVPEWKDWPKVELFARIDGPMPANWFAWGNQARVPQQQQLGIDPQQNGDRDSLASGMFSHETGSNKETEPQREAAE